MGEINEIIVRILFIGIGGTIFMDLWGLLLRQFGIKGLNFAMLGRWIGHLKKGQIIHKKIDIASPIRGELYLGWFAHYSIGIFFAWVLVYIYGLDWARSPSIGPALVVGLATAIAPLFILQPALGAGIASSKTPRPIFNSLKSVVTHLVFGIGMYLAALLSNSVIS